MQRKRFILTKNRKDSKKRQILCIQKVESFVKAVPIKNIITIVISL